MDKTTKQILKKIMASENQTVVSSGIDNPFSDIAPISAVNASIDYLAKNGYIYIDEGLTTQFSVAYRVLHPFQHYLKNIAAYLLQNWIAIVALIISIIALLKQ